MRRWTPVIITLAGLVAAGLALILLGPLYAAGAAITTLCSAAFGTSIVGNTPVRSGTNVSPSEVRQYRLEHPGATISEAIAAVADRQQ